MWPEPVLSSPGNAVRIHRTPDRPGSSSARPVATTSAGLAAWIGALVNTYKLQDRTWFAVLLAGGLLGFAFGLLGFAAMVADLIAGPDGFAVRQPRAPAPTSRPSTLVPTS
jgi:hypothetical protein